jgi:hypothetical protein
MRRWVLCVFCAVACKIGAAQALDEAALGVRLDQVASSHSGKNAFMGIAGNVTRPVIIGPLTDAARLNSGEKSDVIFAGIQAQTAR